MAGLKIRTLENPMQIKMWSETGAKATPIAFNKVYAALQTKQWTHKKLHCHLCMHQIFMKYRNI